MGKTSRRIRALAAGGAVLGIGAITTLATWSDVETFDAVFQAGSFDIEGSTDGISWASHPDSPLNLTFNGSENMIPGVAVYEEYHLRNVGTIPTPITYSATAQGALELGTDLTYRFVSNESGRCDADAVAIGIPVSAGEEFTLEVDEVQAYCIEVKLADSYAQNLAEQGRLIWTFEAVQKPE